jgi:hypothetical protein
MIINHPSIHPSIHHPLEVGSEKESSISNQPKQAPNQTTLSTFYPQALSHLQEKTRKENIIN